MKKGLTATQLKLIAIVAMVIDHTAWGFVEMFSVQGQVMHVLGRLTIPIMCFFVAEGYRKTSNLRKYVERMVLFSIVTMVPFYLFFGDEYGYRQNFFFDLTLALLALIVADSKKLNKAVKVLLLVVVIATSAIIGGWPVFPIMLVLSYYYAKSFKQICFCVAGSVVAVEATLIPIILLNQKYGFSPQYAHWKWYEWLYFFGFILALPLLKQYNGERGKYPIGRYFFFYFYPAHFMVLWSVKQTLAGNLYDVYFALHIIVLLLIMVIGVKVLQYRPSRAQLAASMMAASGGVYVLGFVLEILTDSPDVAYAGVVIEYFGEVLVFLAFYWFISELCHVKASRNFYAVAGMFSLVIMYLLFTTRENHLFYRSIGIDKSGPFHKLALEYGPGFWLFFAYMVLVCGACLIISVKSALQSSGIERKRIYYVLCAMVCPWLAIGLKATGLTGGYEISVLGVLGCICFIYLALFKYGYFDSLQLAGENALHQVDEGIIVVDTMNRILYVNQKMQEIFPNIQTNDHIDKYEMVFQMLQGKKKEFLEKDRYYEVSVIPLIESDFIQGHMICVRDMTQQHKHLEEAERFAQGDALTGLYNRAYFKTIFGEMQKEKTPGYVLMIDADNFKRVNDTYGHGVGDEVLVTIADSLKTFQAKNNLFCRIGGDEFCAFLALPRDKEKIEQIGQELMKDFAQRLEQMNMGGQTSISIGAAYFDGSIPEGMTAQEQLSAVYRLADVALYQSKNAGKGICRIYEE